MATHSLAPSSGTSASLSRPAIDRSADVETGETIAPNRSAIARSGDFETGETIAPDRPSIGRSGDFETGETIAGVIVPGDFRDVEVEVVDTDGDPVETAVYIISNDALPTATRITGGKGRLPLLSTTYTEFTVIGARKEPGEGVDYAWYSVGELQEPIGPTDSSGTIVVDPSKIAGLYAGSGVDFGGMLG
jgi:hypothetical protein